MKIFLPLLAILLIALKLTNVINLPWLWVLSPLWIGFAIILLVLTVVTAITLFLNK